MKVAVTGASGHIGNTLCKELLMQGYEVKALLLENEEDLKQPEIEIIRGNILDKESLNELCKDVDYVFHLAAMISIDKKSKASFTKSMLQVRKILLKPANLKK